MNHHDNRDALLRESIELAEAARRDGNHPFGALLANAAGNVEARAQNTVVTESDVTGHAELNLVRNVGRSHSREELAGMTLYSSTEPCPMCSGAIFWSGIGAVVYALSEERFYRHLGSLPTPGDALFLSAETVLEHGNRPVSVDGPHLEDEALAVHLGFW